MEFIIRLYIILLGLAVGSFLNVVIYRVPNGLSVVKGRSFCPSCRHKLGVLDLVPVFSYVSLRGKCKHCSAPIGIIYPVVEALNAVLYFLAYWQFGISFKLLSSMVIIPCLLCLSFIDAEHGIIPDRFNIIIAVCALAIAIFAEPIWIERLIGAVVFCGFLALIAWLTKGMGWGDVKLFAACGFLLGWKLMLLCVIISSVTASLFSLILMAFRRVSKKDTIPFGPFIAFATLICYLFGNQIIDAYLRIAGLK